jgi:hypothetical protein
MRIRKLAEPLNDKAEGYCGGFPYTTELAGPDGVSIHFWVGAQTVTEEMLQAALTKARRARDVVCASWSEGMPIKFWAHQDIN